MNGTYPRTGYIDSDFRLFYLCEAAPREYEFHYHDFHKLLLFINGNVTYMVEGRSYDLRPLDIVLVRAGHIHRPVVHGFSPYERIILYLSPALLMPEKQEGYDLNAVFFEASDAGSNLVRLPEAFLAQLGLHSSELKASLAKETFAAPLYQKTLVLSLIIWLNRLLKDGGLHYQEAAVSNPLILQILGHINNHLTETLSIDALAALFHVNRSYLMHLFRAETGLPVMRYIMEKRLFLARQFLQNGASVTDACYLSGFSGYACFYRSFRDKFGVSPKDIKKRNSSAEG